MKRVESITEVHQLHPHTHLLGVPTSFFFFFFKCLLTCVSNVLSVIHFVFIVCVNTYVFCLKRKLGVRTREKENNSKSVALTSSLKEDALLTLAKSERNIKSKTFEAFALYICKAFFFSYFSLHARIMHATFIIRVQIVNIPPHLASETQSGHLSQKLPWPWLKVCRLISTL